MVDRNVRRPGMSARRLSGPRYRGAAPWRTLLFITGDADLKGAEPAPAFLWATD